MILKTHSNGLNWFFWNSEWVEPLHRNMIQYDMFRSASIWSQIIWFRSDLWSGSMNHFVICYPCFESWSEIIVNESFWTSNCVTWIIWFNRDFNRITNYLDRKFGVCSRIFWFRSGLQIAYCEYLIQIGTSNRVMWIFDSDRDFKSRTVNIWFRSGLQIAYWIIWFRSGLQIAYWIIWFRSGLQIAYCEYLIQIGTSNRVMWIIWFRLGLRADSQIFWFRSGLQIA